jgi:hypothetical protein
MKYLAVMLLMSILYRHRIGVEWMRPYDSPGAAIHLATVIFHIFSLLAVTHIIFYFVFLICELLTEFWTHAVRTKHKPVLDIAKSSRKCDFVKIRRFITQCRQQAPPDRKNVFLNVQGGRWIWKSG